MEVDFPLFSGDQFRGAATSFSFSTPFFMAKRRSGNFFLIGVNFLCIVIALPTQWKFFRVCQFLPTRRQLSLTQSGLFLARLLLFHPKRSLVNTRITYIHTLRLLFKKPIKKRNVNFHVNYITTVLNHNQKLHKTKV